MGTSLQWEQSKRDSKVWYVNPAPHGYMSILVTDCEDEAIWRIEAYRGPELCGISANTKAAKEEVLQQLRYKLRASLEALDGLDRGQGSYTVCFAVAEKYVTLEAASALEAKLRAEVDVEPPALCHQCSGEVESIDPYVVSVEKS